MITSLKTWNWSAFITVFLIGTIAALSNPHSHTWQQVATLIAAFVLPMATVFAYIGKYDNNNTPPS